MTEEIHDHISKKDLIRRHIRSQMRTYEELNLRMKEKEKERKEGSS